MTKLLTIVTSNKKKIQEITAMLGNNFPIKIEWQAIDLPEYQGEVDDVSRAKCKTAANIVNGAVVVEDTCLCFNALGGMPGPYIKWFLEKLGPSGLYRLLNGWEDKSAVAVCTLAYCEDPNTQNIILFKGEVDGHIVEPRGNTNFGWDPCFQPLGSTKTFAEMTEIEKHQISHRFKAFKLFKEHFIKE